MSESAKQSGEAPQGAGVSEPVEGSERTDSGSAAGAGLLAELLEAGREPGSPQSLPTGSRTGLGASLGTRVGKLVEWSSGRAPRVDFEGNELGPLLARSTIPLDPTIIAEAIRDERGVLLTFEDGKPHAPIITGLLQSFAEVEEAPEVWQDQAPDEPDTEQSTLVDVEARVDGRRVELEAADEIVLRCGKASIVLRRNGRVVIRGTYVETRSSGVNRIKGGAVEIN